jgi:hypothetical protein
MAGARIQTMKRRITDAMPDVAECTTWHKMIKLAQNVSNVANVSLGVNVTFGVKRRVRSEMYLLEWA